MKTKANKVTSALRAHVKKPKIETLSWNLCLKEQFLNIKKLTILFSRFFFNFSTCVVRAFANKTIFF